MTLGTLINYDDIPEVIIPCRPSLVAQFESLCYLFIFIGDGLSNEFFNINEFAHDESPFFAISFPKVKFEFLGPKLIESLKLAVAASLLC